MKNLAPSSSATSCAYWVFHGLEFFYTFRRDVQTITLFTALGNYLRFFGQKDDNIRIEVGKSLQRYACRLPGILVSQAEMSIKDEIRTVLLQFFYCRKQVMLVVLCVRHEFIAIEDSVLSFGDQIACRIGFDVKFLINKAAEEAFTNSMYATDKDHVKT